MSNTSSVICLVTAEQTKMAGAYIAQLDKATTFDSAIATETEPGYVFVSSLWIPIRACVP